MQTFSKNWNPMTSVQCTARVNIISVTYVRYMSQCMQQDNRSSKIPHLIHWNCIKLFWHENHKILFLFCPIIWSLTCFNCDSTVFDQCKAFWTFWAMNIWAFYWAVVKSNHLIDDDHQIPNTESVYRTLNAELYCTILERPLNPMYIYISLTLFNALSADLSKIVTTFTIPLDIVLDYLTVWLLTLHFSLFFYFNVTICCHSYCCCCCCYSMFGAVAGNAKSIHFRF